MRNIKLFCLWAGISLGSLKSFSQSNPNDFAKVTEVLAPPPNAAALSKYGGIDITLNTGMVGKNIPLYDFKTSQLSVPISLSYSSGGFKTDEAETRTGMGWTLNIGGVITRTIVGREDGSNYPRIVPPAQIHTDSISFRFLYNVTDGGTNDAEPDIYNFNFDGYSGKFVYDINSQVVFLPANNLKVERNISGYDFKVTTPDGNMYYFGGTGGTELNKKTSTCGKAFDAWTATAWYLKKIVSPKGQEINFIYEPVLYSYLGGVTESMYLDGIDNAGVPPCSGQTCPVYTSQSKACQSTYNVEGVVLKQITSSQTGSVNIEYINQSSNMDSLFSRITITDAYNATKKIFEFTYTQVQSSAFTSQFQNTTYRDFLQKLSEKSITTSDSKDYQFSYNKLSELPVFNTYAVDHWGFFNGKSNSDYIQKPFNFYDQSQFPNATADRDPDYNFSLKGLLSKIIYPTKGFDTIVYEANTLGQNKTIPPALSTITKSVTGTGTITQVSASSTSFAISYNQDAKLEYWVHDNSGNGSFDTLHNKGSVVLTDLTTNTDIFTDVIAPDNIYHSAVVYPTVGHSYQLTVKANGTVVTTTATLNYRPGTSTVQSNPSVGGVRVKSVLSYTDANATPVIKNYYYSFLNSLNSSTGNGVLEPYYLRTFKSRFVCYWGTNPPQCVDNWCTHSGIFSYAQNLINLYPSGVTYQAVVEGFGNNFENGAIEHVYTVAADWGAENLMTEFSGDNIPGTVPLNNSYYNGKELKQTVYKKSGAQLLPVEKTEYTYKIDSTKSNDVVGCAVVRRYDYCSVSFSNPSAEALESFNAMRYYHQSRWIYIDTVKSTTYDDSGQEVMSSIVKNYYDNPVHMLPSRMETKTSTGETILTQSKYSSDFANLTSSDNLTQGIKSLNDNYILGAEIEKTIFKKDNLGNNQRLIFSTFTSYKPSTYNPDVIYQVEQASPLTDFSSSAVVSGAITKDSRYKSQVSFIQYDQLSNITEQKKTTDVNISYIWDYNKIYPVAAVTNADTAQIAYTSFEADGKGGWSFSGSVNADATSPTGTKCYSLSGGSLSRSSLPAAVYVVSYWSKNGTPSSVNGSSTPTRTGITTSGWTYYEHEVNTTSITISGSGYIDEVRLYPKGSLMTTSTYNFLFGMESQSDANGKITYYDYDGLGRLSYVKDQYRNIIKKICYNYYGQPENCGVPITYHNVVKTGSFTKNNCATGGTGSTVTYTVPANTYASTISQADADNQAQNDVNTNGQTYANNNGICTWWNVQKSGSFTKNNCPTDYHGSTVTYTVAAGTYSSTISQADADSKAQNDVNSNGQAYANTNGTCILNNCTSTNCTGANKKCINDVCSTGAKVYTSSVFDSALHKYVCTYHYEWSDGSWSGDYTEISSTQCPVAS